MIDALRGHVLEDQLQPGLKAVFCGTQAGRQSAQRKAYYAGSGNRFWATLHNTGLTSSHLTPDRYRTLLDLGIGFTDVAKKSSGADSLLRQRHVDREFVRKIEQFAPRLLAFNGKRAASLALRIASPTLNYGKQDNRIGETELYVLPSTSGAASGFWDERYWRDFADRVRALAT